MYMSENQMLVKDALERMHQILDREPLTEPEKAQIPEDYALEFSDVTFRYPDAKEDALKKLNFQIPSGSTVALVGPSGGGKTTVAGLIARFWDPDQGSIRIGNVDVRDMGKQQLSDVISYVFQDSRLLKMSIFENVRLARPDATREEVARALHLAQCDDIIAKFPEGIDTVIGTKGVYLSGGEQ